MMNSAGYVCLTNQSQRMPRITIAYGDGIGPEIMAAVLEVLDAAGADLDYDTIEIGERVYRAGNRSGIAADDWEVIRRNRIFLKAPITTPQGGGYKSLNVSTRKFLGLYANVRPCQSLHPVVRTKHPVMDVVIVRENEEDLYAGIEHQQTDEVVQCLKLISRPGCEKIIRYAFEYARQNGRQKVTCFTKDNIMKQTDGLFHRVFDEIAAEYPDIANDHSIVDIGAARLADTPEAFDVIVMPNLYGDVLSDVAAQITGSVGLAGSSNIGQECAMFEAIHGSAPDIAGKDIANPSGLLQAAVHMLRHLGLAETAERIQNAWLATLEDGIHTADIFVAGESKQRVGTRAFAQAVVAHLGQRPRVLPAVSFADAAPIAIPPYRRRPNQEKSLLGVDIFIADSDTTPDALAARLQAIDLPHLKLSVITNRGIMVWPRGFAETFCTDHWRCRFEGVAGAALVTKADIIDLLNRCDAGELDAIKTENLYAFDGKPSFSLAQGH